MGFRPRFQNPLAGLGQGIQQAGQQIGAFFSKKADQDYQRGIAAIAEAKAEKKRLDELRANPQLELSAEEQAQLNALYEHYDAVENAHPVKAMGLADQGPPGATKASTFTKNVTTARPGLDKVEAGTGRVADGAVEAGTGRRAEGQRPEPETERRTETRTEQIPAGQFVSGLERRARRGMQEREERLLDEERDFVLRRDKQGQDVEIETTKLQNAAALKRAGLDAESRELVAQIAADNNLDVAELQGEIDQEAREYDWTQRFDMTDLQQAHELDMQGNEAGYKAMLENLASDNRVDEMHVQAAIQQARDDRLFDQQKELLTIEDARSEIDTLLNEVRDTSLPMETRRAAAEEARQLREQVPERMRWRLGDDRLGSALGVEDEEARRARLAEIEELETSGVVNRAQASALQSQVRVNDANVVLTNHKATGEEILNERRRFENDQGKITAAVDYVERAINAAMPSRVQELMEEVRNPGTHPQLSHLAEQTTEQELEGALEQAIAMKDMGDREREVARQQLAEAEFTSRAQMANTVGSAFDAEEIDQMYADGEFDHLIEQGLMSESDVSAMKGAAAHRSIIERNERNGPRIELHNDRLWRMAEAIPQNDEERAQMEASVRANTDALVEMGMMTREEANGLLGMFEGFWSQNVTATQLQNRLQQAQIDQAIAQTGLSNARAAAEGADGGLDADLDDIRQLVSANDDTIMDAARSNGCVGESEAERQMRDGVGDDGTPCATYTAQLNRNARALTDVGAEIGVFPQHTAEDFEDDVEMVAVLGAKAGRSSAEEALYQTGLQRLIDRHGSEDAAMQAVEERFGAPTEQERPNVNTSDRGGITGSVAGVASGEREVRPGVRQFWEPAFERGAPSSLSDAGVSREEFQQDLQAVEGASGFGGRETARRIARKYGLLTPGSAFVTPDQIANELRSRFGAN